MTKECKRVVVRTDHEGVPAELEIGGHSWHVAEEPMRWFERTKWWERQSRMPRGQGLIDVEVWRVQARIARNPMSELATLDLERDQYGGGWSLRTAA